ncbi:glycosyltransferase family 77 protein [Brucella sp. HL-2]|nr:glycosyltransferase family 77 protein [Brucella sp. HL-2]MCV9910250.1 glycosyltransferase family 77 protein [Brucella sp. HL-2]
MIDKFRPWSHAHRSMAIAFPNSQELAARKRTQTGQDGTIVAFYTKNSLYEHEKERLLSSARHLGLEVVVVPVENTGSWVRNAGLKPGVLVDLRQKVRGPLLYVDVDAVFHRDPWPELIPIQSDIAVYYEASGHLLSGTILINDTPSALKLLETWQQGCLEQPDTWDQLVLEQILVQDNAEALPLYSVTRLPVSFCWIFDQLENEAVGQIYIEHLQASREAKKRPRLFGRKGKRLQRRLDRLAEIELILND